MSASAGHLGGAGHLKQRICHAASVTYGCCRTHPLRTGTHLGHQLTHRSPYSRPPTAIVATTMPDEDEQYRAYRTVAERMAPFGMQMIAYDPYISKQSIEKMGIEAVSLDELYARADYITVHTPITNETRNLINAAAFQKMKKGVFILNCARGGIVDEAALLRALQSGQVGGAALDVFESEPPKGDPEREPEKEPVKPRAKCASRQYATHQVGFRQARGKEVFAARFPGRRVVRVVKEVGLRPFHDHGFEFDVAEGAGIIERKREAKGGVGVDAGANRVGLSRKKIQITVDDSVGQRSNVPRPTEALRIFA